MSDKKFECDLCKIRTTDQSSFDNHVQGAKHQFNLNSKLTKENTEKCGIFITGIKGNAKKKDVMDFFSKYGKIVEYFCSQNKFTIIQFDNAESVKQILNNKIEFEGVRLQIRPRIVKQTEHKPPKAKPPAKEDPRISLALAQLSRQPTFMAQLQHLIFNLQVHEKYFEPPVYNKICGDIEGVLRSTFINCKVWPFGSTVSGLGFKNSDLDIYVQVMEPLDISSSSDSDCPAAAYVRKAKKILEKHYLFTQVFAIPKAKTPIVKLVHKPTKINCDINFKNLLGVCNSNLIKFLLLTDNRLRPFVFVIKFWALCHEISGSGKISNYGIVMMAVFFLQQLSEPILPPIEMLQTVNTITYIEGWNGGFLRNPQIIPPEYKKNQMSIVQLLYEFFNFWAKFDYHVNVICPLTGRIMLKSDFSHPQKLPPNFYLYKEHLDRCGFLKTETSICLQDPFELCHNVTACVSAKLLEDFQKLCHFSANLFNGNIVHNILPKLFVKQHFDKVKITDDNCIFKIYGTTMNIFNNKCNDVTQCRKLWFDEIHHFMLFVLKEIFFFEVNCVSKDIQTSKAQKLDGQSDIHDVTILDSVTYHCVGYNNLWDARKGATKGIEENQLKTFKGFLQNQIAISEYMFKVLCKSMRLSTPLVDFNLTINCKINPTEVECELNDNKSRKNTFKNMANNISKNFPSWCEKFIRESQNIKIDVKQDIVEITQENVEIKHENNEIKLENVEINQENNEINHENVELKPEIVEIIQEIDEKIINC